VVLRSIFLSLVFLVLSNPAVAATKVQFFPGNFNVLIVVTEDDATQLMKSMNVPWQNSPSGPGKGLYSTDRVFSLACGQPPSGVTCSVVVQSSKFSKIDSSKGEIIYKVSAPESENLLQLFVYNSASGFNFKSSDQKLSIDANHEEFLLNYF
jgi:hypothetical protein